MKTAVSLPDALFKEGETAAKEMKVTRSHLYALALSEFLKQREEDAITEKLNEVYSRVDSRLDPVLRRAQARSLPDDQW
jgi:metal-responsive CopG/Arc/MetJ family transcriptional regulator